MSLDDIPYELVLKIIEFGVDTPRDYATFCGISRRWHDLLSFCGEGTQYNHILASVRCGVVRRHLPPRLIVEKRKVFAVFDSGYPQYEGNFLPDDDEVWQVDTVEDYRDVLGTLQRARSLRSLALRAGVAKAQTLSPFSPALDEFSPFVVFTADFANIIVALLCPFLLATWCVCVFQETVYAAPLVYLVELMFFILLGELFSESLTRALFVLSIDAMYRRRGLPLPNVPMRSKALITSLHVVTWTVYVAGLTCLLRLIEWGLNPLVFWKRTVAISLLQILGQLVGLPWNTFDHLQCRWFIAVVIAVVVCCLPVVAHICLVMSEWKILFSALLGATSVLQYVASVFLWPPMAYAPSGIGPAGNYSNHLIGSLSFMSWAIILRFAFGLPVWVSGLPVLVPLVLIWMHLWKSPVSVVKKAFLGLAHIPFGFVRVVSLMLDAVFPVSVVQ